MERGGGMFIGVMHMAPFVNENQDIVGSTTLSALDPYTVNSKARLYTGANVL